MLPLSIHYINLKFVFVSRALSYQKGAEVVLSTFCFMVLNRFVINLIAGTKVLRRAGKSLILGFLDQIAHLLKRLAGLKWRLGCILLIKDPTVCY